MQCPKASYGGVVQNYVDKCFKSGAMDFDDLLLKTNELLNRFPEVLGKYQNRFRYILVDEYQDTNHSQYLIVRHYQINSKIYVVETMRKVFTPSRCQY
jgi:DNA helicase-2/ATP-dependent DNA helicase PcrA